MRLRLTLEYDGTGFRGWAPQPGLRTVEGTLREALERVFPRWSSLAVAGRTDTGVHGLGQVASVDVEGGPPPEHAPAALNAELPDDVAVTAAAEAEPSTPATRREPVATATASTAAAAAHRSRRADPGGIRIQSTRSSLGSRPSSSSASTTSALSLRPRRSTGSSVAQSSPQHGTAEETPSSSRSPPIRSCATWSEPWSERCSSTHPVSSRASSKAGLARRRARPRRRGGSTWSPCGTSARTTARDASAGS